MEGFPSMSTNEGLFKEAEGRNGKEYLRQKNKNISVDYN